MKQGLKKMSTNQSKKRILVTGAKGIIGKILSLSLADEFEVIQLDLKCSDNNKTEFFSDISNSFELEKTLHRIDPIAIIVHLAASADHTTPWGEILKNNIVGTRNIYECARKQGIKKIVFASSTHLYGAYEGYPKVSPLGRLIRATDPPKPDSDYAVSKGFGELMARQYYELYGIKSICIRIGAVSSDNNSVSPYEKIWLSHNDVSGVFRKALESTISYGVFFATSEILDGIFDISQTKKILKYKPLDNL